MQLRVPYQQIDAQIIYTVNKRLIKLFEKKIRCGIEIFLFQRRVKVSFFFLRMHKTYVFDCALPSWSFNKIIIIIIIYFHASVKNVFVSFQFIFFKAFCSYQTSLLIIVCFSQCKLFWDCPIIASRGGKNNKIDQ